MHIHNAILSSTYTLYYNDNLIFDFDFFYQIIFMFPHTGGKMKIHKNRELLFNTFSRHHLFTIKLNLNYKTHFHNFILSDHGFYIIRIGMYTLQNIQ